MSSVFNVQRLEVMGYTDGVKFQMQLWKDVAEEKIPSQLLFLEHFPVYTLGASFHDENLLYSIEEYEKRGIQIYKTDRGGDVTYHGPGQLVIYPIFNLNHYGRDLHVWMRGLEEVIILALDDLGINGSRFAPHTGVWIDQKKVAAIGVKVKKWTSIHGIALNCNNDLNPFDWIVPCGIQGYGVTSVSKVLGRDVSVAEMIPLLEKAFRIVFG